MDAGVVSGLLQLATQGRLLAGKTSLLKSVASKRPATKRLRRRGAVCGVAAPLRCAPASPSSRLLASGLAALATPPTPFFSNLLDDLPEIADVAEGRLLVAEVGTVVLVRSLEVLLVAVLHTIGFERRQRLFPFFRRDG